MFKELETTNPDLLHFVMQRLISFFENAETGYIARRKSDLEAKEANNHTPSTPLFAKDNVVAVSPRAQAKFEAHLKMPSLDLPEPVLTSATAPMGVASSSSADSLSETGSAANASQAIVGKKKKKKGANIALAPAVIDEPKQINERKEETVSSEAKSASVDDTSSIVSTELSSLPSHERTASEVDNALNEASIESSSSWSFQNVLSWRRNKMSLASWYHGVDAVSLTKGKLNFAVKFVDEVNQFVDQKKFTVSNLQASLNSLQSIVKNADAELAEIRRPFKPSTGQFEALLSVWAKSFDWLLEKNMASLIQSAIEYDARAPQLGPQTPEHIWMKSISNLVKILFVLKLDTICAREAKSGQIRVLSDAPNDMLFDEITKKLAILLKVGDAKILSEEQKLQLLTTHIQAIHGIVQIQRQDVEHKRSLPAAMVNVMATALSLPSGIDTSVEFLTDFSGFLERTLENITEVSRLHMENGSVRKFAPT